ncbi:two-component system CitB family sensor kinase [Lysinibacillus composti]|uniref:histidine kinase n=1 Tax=Lysinibacillus composti TaxID=720633 RepID=A0A3N9UGT4_9BACI|nr:sensor histidine kinase [Lysinibacillus composti]MBM7607838.1 two-component system CitB family sensor kinase [Lysinibacillus composti]RQW75310.1 sensor histidine kinase [Lysinibacillus composti]
MRLHSIQSKLFFSNIVIILLISIATGLSFYFTLSNAIKDEIGLKALQIAKTTANRPDVIAGFYAENPAEVLQPIAEKIRIETDAEYVVIGNNEGIRYAHPVEERIGEKMVGNDNAGVLEKGLSYISEAKGTLGEAIRGKTPVIGRDGTIIGVISVGFLKTDISAIFSKYSNDNLIMIILIVIIGSIFASILSSRLKKELLNYEPIEIAELLKQQNTLIESVREAIIMVDEKGQITVINSAAYKALAIDETVQLIGKDIRQVIPNTQMFEVLLTGEKQLDRTMKLKGKDVLVNRIPLLSGEKVVGAVSSFRLQSEIDRLALELSQVKKYTEALRSQTHEYNNFLYTISGLIQLKNYDSALELIHSEREVQGSLIHFISERLQDPFISGILIGFFNRAKELKVKFILDEDSKLELLPIHIQKHLFVSIIGNLVTNAFEAVEHLPEDERMVRVLILDNGNVLLMEVEDSGKGINREVRDRLFEKRISTKNSSHQHGFGLLKVKENLEELDGEIYTEEGDLGGALFIIEIPKGENSYE